MDINGDVNDFYANILSNVYFPKQKNSNFNLNSFFMKKKHKVHPQIFLMKLIIKIIKYFWIYLAERDIFSEKSRISFMLSDLWFISSEVSRNKERNIIQELENFYKVNFKFFNDKSNLKVFKLAKGNKVSIKQFFKASIIQEFYKIVLKLIFFDLDTERLLKLFKFECWNENIHNGQCQTSWKNLKRYLKHQILRYFELFWRKYVKNEYN